MSEKKTCCEFFRKFFKKQAKSNSFAEKPQLRSESKMNVEDNTEIIIQKKTITTEAKIPGKPSIECSLNLAESDSNSIFYDKNSALIEEIDKKKAIENLNEAYGIIQFPIEEDTPLSQRKDETDKEQFTRVIKGINFKEILAGEDSIVLSERSDLSKAL